MGYLKPHRMDAADRELRETEADSTSVTEVALRYEFNHLGKFAIEYKKPLEESPRLLKSLSRKPPYFPPLGSSPNVSQQPYRTDASSD